MTTATLGKTSILALILFYWSYLAFVTQPIMVHDAQGYHDLGQMVAQKGWKSYFISGPNREPVYPFLIAWTMTTAGQDLYLVLLKCAQFLLLLLTLLISFVVLKRGRVTAVIAVPAVIYLGFSPALVNSALSVYSEIAAYIFILGIVAMGAKAYLELQDGRPAWMWGIGLSGCFVMAAMVKSIYEIIFYLFLIPFLLIVWRRKNRKVIKESLSFLLIVLVIFHGAICGYKYLNKTYNGLFVLTDRAAWAFYGTAARRQVPLTGESFGAAVSSKLLEEEGCKIFYRAEECQAWDITTADKFSAEKNYEVIAKFPPQQQNRELLKASFAKIWENPWQYGVLMILDGVRLFFWESTRIGFVAYPNWLDAVWDQPFFAQALRLLVGILSLAAFIFCAFHLVRNRKEPQCRSFYAVMLFAVYLVFLHFMLYSLFFTLPRFSLPVAPLLIIMIAMSAQILTRKEKQ